LKGFPEKRQLQRRFPIRPADVPRLTDRPVETSWSPLTPEHGFPSLQATEHRALPLCPYEIGAVSFPLSKTYKKPEAARLSMPPYWNHRYDFLRRHYPHQV